MEAPTITAFNTAFIFTTTKRAASLTLNLTIQLNHHLRLAPIKKHFCPFHNFTLFDILEPNSKVIIYRGATKWQK